MDKAVPVWHNIIFLAPSLALSLVHSHNGAAASGNTTLAIPPTKKKLSARTTCSTIQVQGSAAPWPPSAALPWRSSSSITPPSATTPPWPWASTSAAARGCCPTHAQAGQRRQLLPPPRRERRHLLCHCGLPRHHRGQHQQLEQPNLGLDRLLQSVHWRPDIPQHRLPSDARAHCQRHLRAESQQHAHGAARHRLQYA